VFFLAAAVDVNYFARLVFAIFTALLSFGARSVGTVKPIGRFGAAGGAINSRNARCNASRGQVSPFAYSPKHLLASQHGASSQN
jgi:hypothetical protein